MTAPHPLEVRIHPWSEGDLPLLERLMGDPAMTVHLGGPETPEQIRRRHERYCRQDGSGKSRVFAIVVGPDETPAGSVCYWEMEWDGQLAWEAGWSVLPEFQGQGVATQATAAAIASARAEGKHPFMHAFPDVKNGASNAICRRLGFTHLGEIEIDYPPGNFKPSHHWRLEL